MKPDVEPEFSGYFDSLRAGTVSFPYCEDCGRNHWYPMPRCPHCQSERIIWRPVSATGEIWSWTVVRHAFDEKFAEKLPYVVALITFEDAPGIRLIANIEGANEDELRVGLPVELVPPDGASSEMRTVFRPLRAA